MTPAATAYIKEDGRWGQPPAPGRCGQNRQAVGVGNMHANKRCRAVQCRLDLSVLLIVALAVGVLRASWPLLRRAVEQRLAYWEQVAPYVQLPSPDGAIIYNEVDPAAPPAGEDPAASQDESDPAGPPEGTAAATAAESAPETFFETLSETVPEVPSTNAIETTPETTPAAVSEVLPEAPSATAPALPAVADEGFVLMVSETQPSARLKSYLLTHSRFQNDPGDFYTQGYTLELDDGALLRRAGDGWASLVLSAAGETVCDCAVTGEQVLYLTGAGEVVAVDYDGQNRQVVYAFDMPETPVRLLTDGSLAVCQLGQTLHAVFLPTQELLYTCRLPGLQFWDLLSAGMLLYYQQPAPAVDTALDTTPTSAAGAVLLDEENTPLSVRAAVRQDAAQPAGGPWLLDISPLAPQPYRSLLAPSPSQPPLDAALAEETDARLPVQEPSFWADAATAVEQLPAYTTTIAGVSLPLAEYGPSDYFTRSGRACRHHTAARRAAGKRDICDIEGGSCGCGYYDSPLLGYGIQCAGFAKMVYTTLYPTAEAPGAAILPTRLPGSEQAMRSQFADLPPGSYLKFDKWGGGSHYVILLEVQRGDTPQEDRLIFYHANWDECCGVDITAFSYAALAARYHSVSGYLPPEE